jgi:cytochrome b6-f complex iron-sulfur subunit
MADEKKKMSVAEILAAARKGDAAKGGAAPKPQPAADEPAPAEPVASGDASASEAPLAEKPKPAPKPAGGKLSVAEMLAAARAAKGGGVKPAEEAPAAPVEKKEKPAAAAKEKPAKAPAVVTAGGPKDTSSILAAARASHKPGPMSKAEAEARAKPDLATPAKGAKVKAVVPPMPQKPDYAKPKATAAAADDRRWFLGVMLGSALGMGFTTLTATLGLWTLGTARFMFPNILTEPPSRFKVGFPSDFPPGAVEEKFKAQFGVWVVNYEYQGKSEIYALRTVCTHLGCTPNWLEGEQKFKCPCHGSGFYKDGINFEGPAPRPLERYAIRLADDGQIEVDKSKLFQEELGQWVDPSSFVAV